MTKRCGANQTFKLARNVLAQLQKIVYRDRYDKKFSMFVAMTIQNLKPNEQRGKIAVAMLWIMLALYVLMGLSHYFQYLLLARVADGEIVSTEAATANDSRQQLIAIVIVIAYIVSITTFIMWFRRAYYNLHQRAEVLSYTEGWAAGAWFVPFVNLVRPYKIMTELYQQTYALFDSKSALYPKNYTTQYLGWWWAMWILNWLVDRIEFSVGRHAETIAELMQSTVFAMISCAIGIATSLLAIKIITDYMNMEKLLALQDANAASEETVQRDENQYDEEIVVMGPLP